MYEGCSLVHQVYIYPVYNIYVLHCSDCADIVSQKVVLKVVHALYIQLYNATHAMNIYQSCSLY